jgi:hypothetical protein
MEISRSTAVIPEGTVLIVSHDAGGAEILSSFLKLNDIPYLFCLAGTAVNIFQRKIGNVYNYSLEEGIEQVDWVLTGTSWASDLEYRAIVLAMKKKKFVVSFLDHWLNYRERFNWHGTEILPDEIWVGDENAYDSARLIFADLPVRLLPNPFWEEVKILMLKSTDIMQPDDIRILFASTNIDDFKEIEPNITFSDYDILSKFLSNTSSLFNTNDITRITLSQHPSEKINKYSDFKFGQHPYKIVINNSRDTISMIGEHTHVVGFESMLLVLGKVCGKFTINIDMNLPWLEKIPKKYIDYYL